MKTNALLLSFFFVCPVFAGSGPLVDNGLLATANQFPSIVQIGIYGGRGIDSFEGYCTGTMIAPDVVLTSAHCTVQGKNWRISEPGDNRGSLVGKPSYYNSYTPSIYWEFAEVCKSLEVLTNSSRYSTFPEAVKNTLQQEKKYNCTMRMRNDFAFIQLENDKAFPVGKTSSLGCRSDLSVGAEIGIAGFGMNILSNGGNNNSNGDLLYGYNTLDSIPAFDEYFYILKKKDKAQMPNMGDSGGPLFVKGDDSVVYGITLGGEVSNRGQATVAYYPKLSSPSARSFYLEMLKFSTLSDSLRSILTECVK